MISCYIHKPVPYSDIIKEVSSSNRRDPWNTQQHVECLHQIPPLRAHRNCGRGGKKTVRVRENRGPHENKVL